MKTVAFFAKKIPSLGMKKNVSAKGLWNHLPSKILRLYVNYVQIHEPDKIDPN